MSTQDLEDGECSENTKINKENKEFPVSQGHQIEGNFHEETMALGYKEVALKLLEDISTRFNNLEKNINERFLRLETKVDEMNARLLANQSPNKSEMSKEVNDFKNKLKILLDKSDNWRGIVKCLVKNDEAHIDEILAYTDFKGKNPKFEISRAIGELNKKFDEEFGKKIIKARGPNQNKRFFIDNEHIQLVREVLGELRS